MTQPGILFLDEPTTGLDLPSRLATWQAVRELAAAGTTVLLTTQNLDEADQLAGQIAIVDHGRVIADLSIRRPSLDDVPHPGRPRRRRPEPRH